MAEPTGKCPEREKLLSQWTESSNCLARLLDEQLAAIKNGDQAFSSFAERIRLAKNVEIETCRAYYEHVDRHDCF